MSTGIVLFVALVFAAVAMLALGLMVPTVGDSARSRRRLKARIQEITAATEQESATSLLRTRYLEDLPPVARQLERLPFMAALHRLVEQSGHGWLAYRVVLTCVVLAAGSGLLAWSIGRTIPSAALGAAVGALIPLVVLLVDRHRRLMRFEEQLPDAIDIVTRALRAGHPFGSALSLVAQDMDEPIATEFKRTFADINYGSDVRRALLGLLSRVPSIALMAFVTAVLVQRETGGNLAEILDQISHVVRSRFRFQRRVRTLSAEGRLSAWILALVPLAMFGLVWLTTPSYLSVMVDTEIGRQLMLAGGLLAIVGVAWVRRIVRIEV
jgi:tight adherence protein B